MRFADVVFGIVMGCAGGCASAVTPASADGGSQAACVSCGGPCTSLPCDPQNCGACGVVCAPSDVCVTGQCRAPAPAFQWARQFHATSGGAFAVVKSPTGDVVVSGGVQGPADLGSGVTSGSDRGDPVLARYARDGSVQWARRFGSPASDATTFTSLALDPSGNVWTAGSFAYLADLGGATLHAGSFLGGLLARYDEGGHYRFAMAFTNPPDRSVGSSPDNRFVAVGTVPGGDAVVGGYFEGPAILGTETLGLGHPDGIVARVGPSGEIRWRRILSGTGASTVRALAVDATGGTVVTGIFEGTAAWGTPNTSLGSFDTVVVRLDAQGEPVWTASFGGAGDDLPMSLALDGDGNVFIAGSTTEGFTVGSTTLASGGVSVVSLTSAGAFRWARLFATGRVGEAESSGQGVAVDGAGNVVVVGGFGGGLDVAGRSLGDNGHLQGFAALLSPAGVPLWSHAFSGDGDVVLRAVAADHCGGLTFAGSFSSGLTVGSSTFDAPEFADGFVTAWQE